MKNHLQKLALFLMCATCFLFVSAQKTEPWDLPVNSKSEKAVALFQQGIQAMNDVNFVKSTSSFNEALEEDPTFFMPYCMLATFNLYFGNTDEFKSLAQKAIAIKKLPKHEAIMQDALKKLLEDPESDLSEMGNQLVKMYPKSLAAHQMLSTYQSINNNVEGVLQTNLAMLDLTDNDAPIYNMLGYSYMNLGKMDKAKEAFETYIKLAPENPNVYDSMGDYFMAAKEYDNAYKNFMKAHEINDAWSYNKAMKAKELMEKDEVMAVIEKETAAYYANDLAKWAETYSQDTNIYILGAGKDGYGITSGWNNYYTSAKSFFPGQVIQNNEVKTPIRIKVYDNSAWVVFNNKSPNDEFLATCFL
ncbi:MAG TPA: tetratricopeptide repeat protein, partial [Draconibacterium sp.]|nr:tetratricopeptide repeat protein [Draconibacterium sp.]